jgi:predicted nuclease with TOPRIM domain
MPEESKLTEKFEEKQKEAKFSEEELKEIQEIQVSYSNITNRFGQLSVTKLRLQEQLQSLDKQYDELTKNLTEIQENETKLLDEITKKYGQGTLNPETGIFIPNKS